jgi:hypothetical protein
MVDSSSRNIRRVLPKLQQAPKLTWGSYLRPIFRLFALNLGRIEWSIDIAILFTVHDPQLPTTREDPETTRHPKIIQIR